MNRRSFLRTTFTAIMATLAGYPESRSAEEARRPIGCFNRPWGKWSYDEALDAIGGAGYKLTGLLSGHRGEAFTSSAATPAYLASLKKRIAARGLAYNMTAIRFRPPAPLADNISDLRKQIENAARLELRYMLTFGIDDP